MPKFSSAPAAAALAQVGNLPAETPSSSESKPRKPRTTPKPIPKEAKVLADALVPPMELKVPAMKGKKMPKGEAVVKAIRKRSESPKPMAKMSEMPKKDGEAAKRHAAARKQFRDDFYNARKAMEAKNEAVKEHMKELADLKKGLKDLREAHKATLKKIMD